MNELIKVYLDSEQPTILARDLYNGLGIQTKYTTWLERMAEYGFQEGKDFFPFLGKSLLILINVILTSFCIFLDYNLVRRYN